MKVRKEGLNIESQNVCIKAKELIKVEKNMEQDIFGELCSDFEVFYIVTENEFIRNRQFIINVVEIGEIFPDDQQILGVVDNHVIIYN